MKKYYAGLTSKQWISLIIFFSVINATLIAQYLFRWHPDDVVSICHQDSLLVYAHSQIVTPHPNADSIVSFINAVKKSHARRAHAFRNGKIKVNPNTATKIDLMQIPGIGEKLASRILEYRKKNGKFSTIDELINVKGIGKKSIQKFKPFLTLGDSL